MGSSSNAAKSGGSTARAGTKYIAILASAAAAAALLTAPVQGQAVDQRAPAPAAAASVNLNITPKRLILDRSTRAGTVYIFNQGTAPATFDIALVERVMLPTGEIQPVSEASADPALQPLIARLASAQSLLVAAPRRVTLAPGRGQTIRVRATHPAGETGEYRTHLTVTTIPPRESGVSAEQAQGPTTDQLSFRINSVFGLSIPIIVRQGAVDARAAIENIQVEYANISPDGVSPAVRTPVLRLDIRRLGTSSLFGNVEIAGVRGRRREPIGLARGVGVYPEIDKRTMVIPLGRAPRPGEQVEVTFTDDDSVPGRVIARSSLTGS